VLLDTSGLLCYIHQNGPQHREAVQLLNNASKKSLAHSYVLAELITLALIRRFPRPAVLAFVIVRSCSNAVGIKQVEFVD
jgi:predicted nucleic acid-binding protein